MAEIMPVDSIPEPRGSRQGETGAVRQILTEFLDSGADKAEVVNDVDGCPLTQQRIDSLRSHIYKAAAALDCEIGTCVRWDEHTGERRLYLERKQ